MRLYKQRLMAPIEAADEEAEQRLAPLIVSLKTVYNDLDIYVRSRSKLQRTSQAEAISW